MGRRESGKTYLKEGKLKINRNWQKYTLLTCARVKLHRKKRMRTLICSYGIYSAFMQLIIIGMASISSSIDMGRTEMHDTLLGICSFLVHMKMY